MPPTHLDIEHASLLGAGHIAPDSAWRTDAHTHRDWEFVYFLRGGGRIETPGAIWRPCQYHLAVYPPGLPHAETADPIEPEETIFFSLAVAGTAPPDAPLLLPDPHGELRWLSEGILREFHLHGPSPLATTYARAFLYLLERAWTQGLPGPQDPLDAVAHYLHAHYAQAVSLQTLAQIARLSPAHLVHRFSARMGTSPMRYLQTIRHQVAQQLLATTELPVKEVAAQVGYPDPLYFSRLFRTAFGEAPSAYRARIRQS
jgi:AraC family transcriptional regulator of arabinose operon